MLILSRKRGQSIVINQNIEIFVTAIEGEQVKIGISAPKEYSIVRKEVVEDVKQSNKNAVSTKDDISRLKNWVESHKFD
ncbi:carbon storage regulator, CsrA [Paenibacillus curdlanolyticus YK9]|uniref:Translational regulator CsrA n=1 Tax=Paenibacillus curdlanolyticus YK9 TaxID=717606 RepID=E0IEC9_9BACL|nr:carbon storage regulator CsrA [Paenibacillus curdlanolyticus]EFM09017.1 carbon storage regulator, CsrA [Paenibacillus curdlanolyticus YK9]